MCILPQDDTIGSTSAFIALQRKMIEMNVIGIARLIPRSTSQPRLVALVAQDEVGEPCSDVYLCEGMLCVVTNVVIRLAAQYNTVLCMLIPDLDALIRSINCVEVVHA